MKLIGVFTPDGELQFINPRMLIKLKPAGVNTQYRMAFGEDTVAAGHVTEHAALIMTESEDEHGPESSTEEDVPDEQPPEETGVGEDTEAVLPEPEDSGVH